MIHTHHIDLDHSNNNPENLVDLTTKQHSECHRQLMKHYLNIFDIKNVKGSKIHQAMKLAFSPLIKQRIILFDRANLCYFVPITTDSGKKQYLMPLKQGVKLERPHFFRAVRV